MDKARKLINDLAKDSSKHKGKGDKLWAKAFGKNISSKRSISYKRKAKEHYRISESIDSAQSNLPNITRNTNVVIASNNRNNKILSNNKATAKLSSKVTINTGKKKK